MGDEGDREGLIARTEHGAQGRAVKELPGTLDTALSCDAPRGVPKAMVAGLAQVTVGVARATLIVTWSDVLL